MTNHPNRSKQRSIYDDPPKIVWVMRSGDWLSARYHDEMDRELASVGIQGREQEDGSIAYPYDVRGSDGKPIRGSAATATEAMHQSIALIPPPLDHRGGSYLVGAPIDQRGDD